MTREQKLEDALRDMVHAVCGPTGLHAAVKIDTGMSYPWPALDLAEDAAMNAIATPPDPSPALAALAMRERAAELCFVPEQAHIAWDMKSGNFPKRSARHEYIAAEIRALPTTFPDAELLAAAMTLSTVRALVDAASHMVSADAWSTKEYRETRPEEIVSTVSNLLYALAPFRK